jgi:hypothetical protein
MRFDTKIAIAVRGDLAVWQKLNVTTFQPVVVYGANAEQLSAVHQKGLGRGLALHL